MTGADSPASAPQQSADAGLSSKRSFGAVLAERLLYVGSTAAAFYVAAALTSLDVFGRFTAVLALVQLAVSFGGMGLDGVLVHELAHSTRRTQLIATARSIRAVGFTVGAVVAVAVAGLLRWDGSVLIAVAILAVAQIGQANFAYDAALQADERFTRLSANRLVGNVTSNLLVVAVAVTSPTVVLLVAARAVEPVLTGLLHRRSYPGTAARGRFDAGARVLLARSWPVALAALFMVTYMRVDAIMLSVLRSDADVAVYALAARAAESFNFVSVALMTVLFARLIKLDIATSTRQQAQFLRRMLFAGLAVAPAAILVGFVTPALTGDEYVDVPGLSIILALSIPGSFLLAALSKLAISMQRERASLAVAASTAVVNVVANTVLIPAYGISGAAVSTLLASLAGPAACGLLIREMRPPLSGICLPLTPSGEPKKVARTRRSSNDKN